MFDNCLKTHTFCIKKKFFRQYFCYFFYSFIILLHYTLHICEESLLQHQTQPLKKNINIKMHTHTHDLFLIYFRKTSGMYTFNKLASGISHSLLQSLQAHNIMSVCMVYVCLCVYV